MSILEEFPVEFDDWEEAAKNDSWPVRILKIWFTLAKNFTVIHKWAKFPECLADDIYLDKAKTVIEEIVEELDSYLMTTMEEADLDQLSTETLARIECLI